MLHKPGDKVRVVTQDETVEGILMPNEETDSVVIKLDSGYNMGIENKKVKKIILAEKFVAKKVNDLCHYVVIASDVVHELQKERGASAVYIGSKGGEMRVELENIKKSV